MNHCFLAQDGKETNMIACITANVAGVKPTATTLTGAFLSPLPSTPKPPLPLPTRRAWKREENKEREKKMKILDVSAFEG